MYRFLLDHREVLLSPLCELAHEQVRFVYRPTKVYHRGLARSLLGSRRDGLAPCVPGD